MTETNNDDKSDRHDRRQDFESGKMYVRFFAMILSAMVAMYLLTYLNSAQILGHAGYSETRLFMTMIMGGSMMIIMLAFMLQMYKNTAANVAIFATGALLMAVAIWLVRSQVTVDDVDYMEAMIPHHSIAILTSERSRISDPRVRELADEIIAAQRREIAEMKVLIEDIRANGARKETHNPGSTEMFVLWSHVTDDGQGAQRARRTSRRAN